MSFVGIWKGGNMSTSPLAQLLIDPKENCEKLLLGVLEKFVCLEKHTGEVVLKPEFSRLPKKSKILVFLAARKAGKLLGLISEEHAPSDCISEATGVGLKTTRETLSKFKKERTVDSNSEGGWYIPDKNLILLPEYFNRFLKTE